MAGQHLTPAILSEEKKEREVFEWIYIHIFCCVLIFSHDSNGFWTGISASWANKYLFFNLSDLVLKLYSIVALPGSMGSRRY